MHSFLLKFINAFAQYCKYPERVHLVVFHEGAVHIIYGSIDLTLESKEYRFIRMTLNYVRDEYSDEFDITHDLVTPRSLASRAVIEIRRIEEDNNE